MKEKLMGGTLKASLLTALIAVIPGCSLTGLIPSVKGPSFTANTAVQKGNNSLYDGTVKGEGNLAKSNQQVISGAQSVTVTQGLNPWAVVLLMGGTNAATLFLLGLAMERPRRRMSKSKKPTNPPSH